MGNTQHKFIAGVNTLERTQDFKEMFSLVCCKLLYFLLPLNSLRKEDESFGKGFLMVICYFMCIWSLDIIHWMDIHDRISLFTRGSVFDFTTTNKVSYCYK